MKNGKDITPFVPGGKKSYRKAIEEELLHKCKEEYDSASMYERARIRKRCKEEAKKIIKEKTSDEALFNR